MDDLSASERERLSREAEDAARSAGVELAGDRPESPTVYVLQTRVGIEFDTGAELVSAPIGGDNIWRDVAIVEVPPRTKRRKVIELALAQASIEPEGDTSYAVRVLDMTCAEIVPVKPRSRPVVPEWEIG